MKIVKLLILIKFDHFNHIYIYNNPNKLVSFIENLLLVLLIDSSQITFKPNNFFLKYFY